MRPVLRVVVFLALLVGAVVLAPPAGAVVTVTVTPSVDLVDNQVVTVAGEGFEPNEVVLVCEGQTSVPTADPCGSVEAGAVAFVDGAFTVPYTVRRFVSGPGGPVDCADPGEQCRVWVTGTATSTVTEIPLQFAPVLTRLVATPSTDLVDGQTVTVSGSGFPPNLSIGFCQAIRTTNPSISDCGRTGAFATTDAEGRFSAGYLVGRYQFVPSINGTVDCASSPGLCVMGAADLGNIGGTAAYAPLTFRPDPPAVVPGAGSVVEGASGATDVTVPVSLSWSFSLPVTVQWVAVAVPGAPGFQADPGTDYVPSSGMVTFAPGETTQSVAVPIAGDLVVEPDEYVVVLFGNPTNAVMGGFWGLGFAGIQNDD